MDRVSGKVGFCGQADHVRAARAAAHFWEEPCISGKNGSGTVFFSGCVLKCGFCQNFEISTGGSGAEISQKRLGEIFLELQMQGVHNINLVSPTQFTPQIIGALDQARYNGLYLPVVWNTGGYEKPETIAALKGYADIFLSDFKFIDEGLAEKYSGAANYPFFAKSALFQMLKIAGEPIFDDSGLMKSGVIVRHLAMPGCISDTKAVLKWLYKTFGNSIYISIMSQYTPPSPNGCEFPTRRLHRAEYARIIDYAVGLGMENAFVQDLSSAGGKFVPPFDLLGIVK